LEREFNKFFVTMNTVPRILATKSLLKATNEDDAFNDIHAWLGSLGNCIAVNEASARIQSLLRDDFVNILGGPGPKHLGQDITIYLVLENNTIRFRKVYG
jgi:hypothetical protein